MAHPEDPPYLTVGTEVSAKYRGAFCEATIKVAERLVKCKVSYGKGQSTLVTNDSIKGSLKVGTQVDVKQSDGQVIPATLLKVTDNSTYTVVFDDGDERTLKRSSLCLKGGRHFHESESLDCLPLTDPENFGTPVNANLKKSGRRRRHASRSPPWEETAKKNYRCPSQFAVGKPGRKWTKLDEILSSGVNGRNRKKPNPAPSGLAVFLENDRRRSSWLPAVVVPPHYVLEPSEITPETICLRSFKDGRYHVATENELHVFSPDKEPLLSMLEGEVQAMYMCKPAIERAMAYLDTKELPWDMDIFDEHPPASIARVSELSTSEDDQHHRKDEEDSAESNSFHLRLKHFHETRGTPIVRQPTLVQRDLNLFQLYQRVTSIGGMERVTQEMKWCSVHLQLGLPPSTTASHSLRQAYKKYLYQFELHEKNKARVAAKEGGKWASSSASERGNKTPSHATEEERDQPHTPASGGRRGGGGEPMTRVNGMEKGKRGPPTDTPIATKRGKMMRPSKAKELVTKQPSPDMETEEEEEEDKSCMSDSKSEASDFEPPTSGACTTVDRDWSIDRSSSASNLDRGMQRAGFGEGLEKCPDGYCENDRVLVLYGKVKTQRLYEAKVINVEDCGDKKDYLVHYSGWNNRYNEWIESGRIMGKIVGPIKARPHFNKRKKMSKNGSTDDLFSLSLLPPGSPSPASTPLSHTSQSHPQLPSQSHAPLLPQPVFKPMVSVNKESTDRTANSSTCKKEPTDRTPSSTACKKEPTDGTPSISSTSCKKEPTDRPSSSTTTGSKEPTDRTPSSTSCKKEPTDGTPSSSTTTGSKEPTDRTPSSTSCKKEPTDGTPSSSTTTGSKEPTDRTPSSTSCKKEPTDGTPSSSTTTTGSKEPTDGTPSSSTACKKSSSKKMTVRPSTSSSSATSSSPSSACSSAEKDTSVIGVAVRTSRTRGGKQDHSRSKHDVNGGGASVDESLSSASSAPPPLPAQHHNDEDSCQEHQPATPPSPVKALLSATKLQTPAVKPQTPGKSQISGKPQTPVTKLQTPVTKPQAPVAKPQTPVTKLQTPVVESPAPVTKLQTPVKPQAPVMKPQDPITKLQVPIMKSQAPEVKLQPPAEKCKPLVVSPATTQSRILPTPPLPPSSILICSERLPGLVMKQPPPQPPTDNNNNNTLSEPAQSLLSLAMSPIPSRCSPTYNSTLKPLHLLLSTTHCSPSNHISSLANVPRGTKSSPQSLPASRSCLTNAGTAPYPLSNNSFDFDPTGSDMEEEEEDEEDDREGAEEGISDDEEEDEGDEQSLQRKTPSCDISNSLRKGSSLADAKACLDAVLECVEQRSLDSLSASDKEGSPGPGVKASPSSFKLRQQLSISSSSLSPEGKKKWREYESSDEYEQRKKARHSTMNYLLNFGDLPTMSSVERISLIQERLQNVKRRWSDLKNEVAYIERKRKRAKRKGKAAPLEALGTSPSPPSPPSPQPQQQLHTTITCH